jgi:hypothetical protein
MRKNVTFIEDLVDVDTFSPSQENTEREQYQNQVQKRHIRPTDKNNYMIAMNGGNYPDLYEPEFDFRPRTVQPPPTYYQQPPPPPSPPMTYQQQQPDELSCMTVSNHIKDCPICSKFYNCDNSVYIVCIVLLIIICIILLKKIIEKS